MSDVTESMEPRAACRGPSPPCARRRWGAVVRRAGAWSLAVAGAVSVGSAGASAQSSPWLPKLTLDNDAYNFWIRPGRRTDEEYTNGVVASLETLRAPWWGRRFAKGTPACADPSAAEGASRARACLATTVSLTQDIYTPNLDRPPFSEPDWEDERPYAAWLGLSGAARVVSPRQLRVVELAAGVTGTPALGRLAQSIAHRITRPYTTKAEGWETQVGFEPGVVASYHHSLLAVRWESGGRGVFDLVPDGSVSLGTVYAGAGAGARARLGVNLSHPWDPRAWRGRADWEAFLSGGARREYVARNFSLDGTVLNPERRVARVPGVGEYDVGAGVRLRRLSLAYRAVTRSREYVTGPAHHTFSSMSAAIELIK